MAWISVYEEIIRDRKMSGLARKLACSKNEAIGILVSLWTYGIHNANEDGAMIGVVKEDLWENIAFTLSGELNPEIVVDELIEAGWVDEDEYGCLYLHNWSRWQEYYYKAEHKRLYNAEYKRKWRARVNPKEEKPKAPTKPKASEKKGNYTATGFNEFWEAYPRKDDKGQAYKKYVARIKDGWKPEELINAAELYAQQELEKNTPMEFIKQAKTFLGDSTPFAELLSRNNEPVDDFDDDDPFKQYRK